MPSKRIKEAEQNIKEGIIGGLTGGTIGYGLGGGAEGLLSKYAEDSYNKHINDPERAMKYAAAEPTDAQMKKELGSILTEYQKEAKNLIPGDELGKRRLDKSFFINKDRARAKILKKNLDKIWNVDEKKIAKKLFLQRAATKLPKAMAYGGAAIGGLGSIIAEGADSEPIDRSQGLPPQSPTMMPGMDPAQNYENKMRYEQMMKEKAFQNMMNQQQETGLRYR